jgi:hypothetical protein
MSTQSSNWEAFRSKLVACTVNRGKEHISDIRMGGTYLALVYCFVDTSAQIQFICRCDE